MAAPDSTNAVANAARDAANQVNKWKEKGVDFLLEKGPNLLGALVILVAGFMLARFIGRLLNLWLEKRHMDPPVRMLLLRTTWLLIMALFFMIALGTMGIAVGPLIALMSVAGVGIGLATQGVLSNLVAGLVIIFTKPFRIGEYIEIIGCYGQVNIIDMFNTVLIHPDKSRVVIPNRKIVGEVLHNYGTMRQQDITIGVAYGTNLPAAIAIVQQVLAANPKVLKEPAPLVVVSSFGESGINLAIKPWSNLSEFAPAGAEIRLAIVEAFREQRIHIALPQREVRVISPAAPAA